MIVRLIDVVLIKAYILDRVPEYLEYLLFLTLYPNDCKYIIFSLAYVLCSMPEYVMRDFLYLHLLYRIDILRLPPM